MSLALTQPPGGLTFNPETIGATATETMAVGEVVHITDAGLIAMSAINGNITEVAVTKMAAAAGKCGFYGVVTSEITATSSGRISLSGINDCRHLGGGLAADAWIVGLPLTVNASGQLIGAVDKAIIVAYAMEMIFPASADAPTGKAFMVGGPAIKTASIS